MLRTTQFLDRKENTKLNPTTRNNWILPTTHHARKWYSPWSLQKEMQPAAIFIITWWDLCRTCDLQNFEIISLSYFKPKFVGICYNSSRNLIDPPSYLWQMFEQILYSYVHASLSFQTLIHVTLLSTTWLISLYQIFQVLLWWHPISSINFYFSQNRLLFCSYRLTRNPNDSNKGLFLVHGKSAISPGLHASPFHEVMQGSSLLTS